MDHVAQVDALLFGGAECITELKGDVKVGIALKQT